MIGSISWSAFRTWLPLIILIPPMVMPSGASAKEGQPIPGTFDIRHRQLVASLEKADRDICTGVAQKFIKGPGLGHRDNRIVCSRSDPNANGRQIWLHLRVERN